MCFEPNKINCRQGEGLILHDFIKKSTAKGSATMSYIAIVISHGIARYASLGSMVRSV